MSIRSVSNSPMANGGLLNVSSGQLPAGSVLQVVSTTKTDTFTTTSTSFADVTGLTVNITPVSTSSKVYVSVSIPFAADGTTSQRAGWSVFRGSTNLVTATSPGNRTPVAHFPSDNGLNARLQFRSSSFLVLDLPNTTSETTYKVMAIVESGGNAFINRAQIDGDVYSVPRGVSTITLMEVAG